MDDDEKFEKIVKGWPCSESRYKEGWQLITMVKSLKAFKEQTKNTGGINKHLTEENAKLKEQTIGLLDANVDYDEQLSMMNDALVETRKSLGECKEHNGNLHKIIGEMKNQYSKLEQRLNEIVEGMDHENK